MKVYRIKSNLKDILVQNTSVCFDLLKILDGERVSKKSNDQITVAVNALAQLACNLYDELHPEEEKDDEDIC